MQRRAARGAGAPRSSGGASPPTGRDARSAARRCSSSMQPSLAGVGHGLRGDAVVREELLVQLVPATELIDGEEILDRGEPVRRVTLLRQFLVGRPEVAGVGEVALRLL